MRRALPLLAALLLLPALAHAAPPSIESDESPKRFTTSLNFGGVFFEDTNIQAAYGSAGQFFPNLTFGLVPWSKIIHIEVDVGIAFAQFSGEQQFLSGGASSGKVMMTVFPHHRGPAGGRGHRRRAARRALRRRRAQLHAVAGE